MSGASGPVTGNGPVTTNGPATRHGPVTRNEPVARQAFPHPRVRPDWLGGLREAILEPDLPIVDPHHHLWRARPDRYLAEDLAADTATGHDIRATVFIQCGSAYRQDGPEELRPVGETAFVVAEAKRAETMRTGDTRPGDTGAENTGAGTRRGAVGSPQACAGIVGYADCHLGDRIEDVLRAHLAAGEGRFKGIRHSATYDPAIAPAAPPGAPAGLFLDPAFRAGFARAGAMGLTFEAWCYHPQLGELADMLRAHPGGKVVLNHLGGPLGVGPYETARGAVFAQWSAGMRALARFPNLFVKLGGLAMNVNGFGFHRQPLPPGSGEMARAWRPYMETAIEAFGAERCMFESNFPVDKGMCSYPVLWNAFKRIAAGCSLSEKTDLFTGAAIRFYGLPPLV